MTRKVKKKTKLYVWRDFLQLVNLSCILKIDDDIRYRDNFDLFYKLKFVQIMQ